MKAVDAAPQPQSGASSRSRRWSWVFGISSFILPAALFCYLRWQFNEWLAQQDGRACGLGFLAVVFQPLALALLLSLASLACGLWGYFRLARPRPGKRLIETLALGSASIVIVIASLLAALAEAF